MAKKIKPTPVDPDNVLGWSKEDFEDVICNMVNLKVANNLPLTPTENLYYGHYGHDWYRRKLGITPNYLLQARIKKLEEELQILKGVEND